MVVVRVFVKRTQKTPWREIGVALERAREKAHEPNSCRRFAQQLGEEPQVSARVRSAGRGDLPRGGLIEARTRAGLTQEQVARRAKATQAVIARMEGGGSKLSTGTLERYAEATVSHLRITFEPERANVTWRRARKPTDRGFEIIPHSA
jgi:hypothetical protein